MGDPTIPLTRLDAVNAVLRAAYQGTISRLNAASTNSDAELAVRILDDTTREVQQEGWNFNTERGMALSRNSKGNIRLPGNTLRVDAVFASDTQRDLVMRGRNLYDRLNHTDTFPPGTTVWADVVLALAFADLPPAARWYVTVRAARRYAPIKLASASHLRFTAIDEDQARTHLELEDALARTAIEVQQEGWYFNTERGRTLTPSGGQITLPVNTLRVDAAYSTTGPIEVAIRGRRLYDLTNGTFSFSGAVVADVVVGMAFNDLPPPARSYIEIKAKRRAVSMRIVTDAQGERRDTGSERYTEEDEAHARSLLEQEQILRDTSREVQQEGWCFNTDRGRTLTPSAGQITLPANTLKVDAAHGDAGPIEVAMRGRKLYDTANGTLSFSGPVVADVTVELPVNDLPPLARTYVTIKATRRNAAKMRKVFDERRGVITTQVTRYTERDEAEARAALELEDVIKSTSRAVQQEGWHFNTDKKVLLEPDGNNEIALPANALNADAVYRSKRRIDVVMRGRKLYDRVEHSYEFSAPVYVDVVYELPYASLPSVVQQYIMIRAERQHASRRGDTAMIRYSEAEEAQARVRMEQWDSDNDDRTMATASPHVARMRRNRGGRSVSSAAQTVE